MSIFEQNEQYGWQLLLTEEWRKIADEFSLLKKIKEPQIEIYPRVSSFLGQWKSGVISLSETLLKDYPWSEIIAVFKHEIAHQIVEEYFHETEQTAHGTAFKKACEMLEISPEASHKESQEKTEFTKVRNKIQKLLALGESNNPHEAELALKRARDLALKHQIPLLQEQKQDISFRPVGPLKKKVPNHYSQIICLLRDFYFVKVLRTYREIDDETFYQFEIYGSLENLELAHYVFDFLIQEGEDLWHIARRLNGLKGLRQKNSFFFGLYQGFREKLESEQLASQSEMELIHIGLEQVSEFYYERNENISRGKSRRRTVDLNALAQGQEQGRNLSVRQGVSGKSPVRGFLK